MNNKEIAQYINNWFLLNQKNPSRWSDNEIGQIIKKNLKITGNWKNAPRGDSRKGGKIKLLKKNYQKAIEEGFEGSFEEFQRYMS
jgi:hypothetical protein